jgi:hypothetical protein
MINHSRSIGLPKFQKTSQFLGTISNKSQSQLPPGQQDAKP